MDGFVFKSVGVDPRLLAVVLRFGIGTVLLQAQVDPNATHEVTEVYHIDNKPEEAHQVILPLLRQFFKKELHQESSGFDKSVNVNKSGKFEGKVVDVLLEDDQARNGGNGVEDEVPLDVVQGDGLDVFIALGFLDEVEQEVHQLEYVEGDFNFVEGVV